MDFPVYEVFSQPDALTPPIHVGSVRAASPYQALQLARESLLRREAAYDVWVAPTAAIARAREHPETLPSPLEGKEYRLPSGYNNGPLWKKFKTQAQRIEDVAQEMATPPEGGKRL
jgi:phenylacetate-CoA oxygenase PaaH subunit